MIDRKKLEEARRWGSHREHKRALLTEAGAESGHVWVHGQRIHYARLPGEGRPLLLCNGIGANLELALPFARHLSEAGIGPVVLFDLPGVGGSAAGPLVTGLSWYARIAIGLMDALDVAGPFVVAGVSWGGALAQRIAYDYPGRVSELVLMATSPGVTMFPGRPRALLRMVTPRRYFSKGYMARNAHIIYGGEMKRNPELAVEFARSVRAPSTLTYIQQLYSMATFSSLPWLGCLRCPVLVMGGDDDPLIRTLNLRVLAALARRSTLRIIPGGGHLFMIMQPARTAAVVRDFLATGCVETA